MLLNLPAAWTILILFCWGFFLLLWLIAQRVIQWAMKYHYEREAKKKVPPLISEENYQAILDSIAQRKKSLKEINDYQYESMKQWEFLFDPNYVEPQAEPVQVPQIKEIPDPDWGLSRSGPTRKVPYVPELSERLAVADDWRGIEQSEADIQKKSLGEWLFSSKVKRIGINEEYPGRDQDMIRGLIMELKVGQALWTPPYAMKRTVLNEFFLIPDYAGRVTPGGNAIMRVWRQEEGYRVDIPGGHNFPVFEGDTSKMIPVHEINVRSQYWKQ